jgi:hypothetical protein
MDSAFPDPIDCDAAVAALWKHHASLSPVQSDWSPLFLATAFEYEVSIMQQAAAPPLLAIELLLLSVHCAEAGLVQFHDTLFLYRYLARQSSAVGMALATNPKLKQALAPPPPAATAEVTPWTLFATPGMADTLAKAAEQLDGQGYAVVDGLLGAAQATAVSTDFRKYVGESAETKGKEFGALTPGELDATKRSHPALRGDLICWLSGAELQPKWRTVGAAAQLLRTDVLAHLLAGAGAGEGWARLVPPKAFMGQARRHNRDQPAHLLTAARGRGQAMLSVYPPGSVGFAPHVDRSRAAGDRRKVTAIYYLNPEWQPADGGLSLRASGVVAVVWRPRRPNTGCPL